MCFVQYTYTTQYTYSNLNVYIQCTYHIRFDSYISLYALSDSIQYMSSRAIFPICVLVLYAIYVQREKKNKNFVLYTIQNTISYRIHIAFGVVYSFLFVFALACIKYVWILFVADSEQFLNCVMALLLATFLYYTKTIFFSLLSRSFFTVSLYRTYDFFVCLFW